MLVKGVIHSCKCLPAALEVERVGAVDVLLALIAEAGPNAELAERVARVELYDDLANARGIVA